MPTTSSPLRVLKVDGYRQNHSTTSVCLTPMVMHIHHHEQFASVFSVPIPIPILNTNRNLPLHHQSSQSAARRAKDNEGEDNRNGNHRIIALSVSFVFFLFEKLSLLPQSSRQRSRRGRKNCSFLNSPLDLEQACRLARKDSSIAERSSL